MAKPSDLYAWDTNQTNETVPTAGHQSDGYAVNEIPTSGELNALLRNLTEWTSYLNSGALEGDHSITGTLDVSSDLTAGGTFDLTGAATLLSTLDVTGDVVCSADFSAPNGTDFSVDIDGNLEWNGTTIQRFNNGGGVLNPGAGATVNNVNIDFWGATSVIQMSPGAGATVTGFTGGVDGRVVEIWVTANALIFAHDNAGSTAANRFFCRNSANITAQPYTRLTARYSSTLSRWLLCD